MQELYDYVAGYCAAESAVPFDDKETDAWKEGWQDGQKDILQKQTVGSIQAGDH